MMNAMMMMPSSSCSPEEREKRKKSEAAVLHLKNVKNTQICRLAHFFRKRPRFQSLLITTTSEEGNEEDFCPLLRLRAANRVREKARVLVKEISILQNVLSIGTKECRHRMRIVVLVLVALAINARSSTKKKSQSTNDEKRGNEYVPNGKKRRRIPERIRPGTDGRREEEKRGTRKSGRISSHGRVPGTFEKQQRRGVQRERHGEKQRVRGPLERNRDVNHSGYRRERKLGQSRQSRLRATESAVTLQLPTLVPEDAKVPDGMGRAAVRRPVRGPARFRYDFGRRVRHGNGPGELSVFEERPSRRSWRLI